MKKRTEVMGLQNLTIICGLVLTLSGLGKLLWELVLLSWGTYALKTGIGELERRMELANSRIEDLVSKHIEEEEVKITQMQEQLEWYQTELNLNPLSWGKKKKKEKVILTEDDFNHNYFINREMRRKR